MLSRMSILFSFVLSVGLFALACGDDEPADTTPDAGDVIDQGGDLPSEVTPDVVEDQEPDETPDVVEEPDVVELPEGACNTVDDCEDGQECIGGGCVDPIEDIDEYLGEAAERPNSYTWMMQIPTLLPQREECCFEYDGNPDNGVDNALGDLAPVIQMLAGIEIQPMFDEYIENGTITLVVDWKELPVTDTTLDDGDARLAWFLGQVDPEETWGTRLDGDGNFYLEPSSIGTYGSLVQFNRATVDSGVVEAGPSTFDLTIPPIPGYFDDGLLVTLQKAQIEAEIILETNGVHTEDEIKGEDEEDQYTVGGGKLGGVIDAPQILGYVNDFASRSCACAGVGPEEDLVEFYEGEDEFGVERFVVECAEEFASETYSVPICCDEPGDPTGCIDGTPGDDCCASDDFCTYIPTVCEYTDIVGEILDTDLNDNGIPDGMSAGILFGWTGANIAGLVPEE